MIRRRIAEQPILAEERYKTQKRIYRTRKRSRVYRVFVADLRLRNGIKRRREYIAQEKGAEQPILLIFAAPEFESHVQHLLRTLIFEFLFGGGGGGLNPRELVSHTKSLLLALIHAYETNTGAFDIEKIFSELNPSEVVWQSYRDLMLDDPHLQQGDKRSSDNNIPIRKKFTRRYHVM
ncbi:hypothetical protein K1719_026971 [Acacia pycnantha]|nr:hypothetical protein K1719_026971 [Acacia pycnantha]